ncbi:MAG TPA: hypothetical protein VGP07_04180 [Polyangia bacterium]
MRIGQVLVGLLDDVVEPDDADTDDGEPSLRATTRGHSAAGSPSLFDLMMAAVDKKFDADDDDRG